jgi:plastocyanin
MSGILQVGGVARRSLLRRALGIGVVALIGVRARKAAAREQEAEVVIDNFTFAPTPLMVSVGETVKWMNHDDIPHSIVCLALNVKSHTLDTDDSFEHRFEQAGTFEYMCGLHPHMRGQVTVKA